MRLLPALLLGLSLPSLAHAQAAAQPSAPAAAQVEAASPAVPPLAFTQRTLANGLRVYAIHDANTANVSVQVWYDVGSKDDPKGRSGFAHMFEHLMFKGTRNLAAEQFDRLTEDVGGYNNASTNDDYTNYYEVVPANHLQRLLFAEADRMASLVVTPEVFHSERMVVQEELRSRVLAAPYGKLFYLYFPEISFTHQPYARPGIGSIADLDAATITDIKAFHATYYRPDNAVLVVAGNFDPDQLNQWVDQYFAPIKRPDRPIPRVNVAEPVRTAPTHYTVYEPNTPLPAVLISYQAPADRSPDVAPLSVLDAILATGNHSRLHDSLVYDQQIAQSVGTYLDTKQSGGAFAVYTILAGGKSAADGEAALRRQIALLRDKPVTQEELTEAKNEILTGAIEQRETAQGQASLLAASVVLDGDPHAADRRLAAIAQVTAADVQRVAREYLADDRSATVLYLPDSDKPAGKTGDSIAVPATVQEQTLVPPADIPDVQPASAAERVPLPPPGKPVQALVPTPQETRLANGMRLIVVERHELPLVTAGIVVEGGETRDPQGHAGVNALMADLLTKGTTTRSATQIAEQFEYLGGSIDSDSSWDGAALGFTVKTDEFEKALGIAADVARNPAFAPEEIERARTQAIDGVSVALKDPGALAGMAAARAVFGATPYGHVGSGTPTSLKAITRPQIASAYAASWRPDRAALVIVGDIDADGARALAEKYFGSWKAEGPATPDPRVSGALPAPRVVVIDLPGSGQAGVVVARPGIARSNPIYYSAQVANAALGVGFSSRLNEEIRIKRGLSYGAGSSLDARRDGGVVAASTQTKNPSAAEVVSIIVDQMRGIGAAPAPASELDARKAVLIGGFGRSTETDSGIASILGRYVQQGVPLSELKRFVPSITAVDAAAVQAAAREVLAPGPASIVVVGDAKSFVGDLRKTYPQLEVIPAASLNLDSPTLK